MTSVVFSRRGAVAAVSVLALAMGLGSAGASVLNFDFGNLNPAAAPPSTTNSTSGHIDAVLGANEQYFRVGGVTAGLEAFFVLNAANGASTAMPAGVYPGYVTQKNAGSGETGAGVSTIKDSAGSDKDLEIVPYTYLMIDNRDAVSKGYKSNDLTLESMQTDKFSIGSGDYKGSYTLYETAQIYAYTGDAPTSVYDSSGNPVSTTFDPHKLTQIATVTASNGVTQTIAVPNDDFLVITADPMVTGGVLGANSESAIQFAQESNHAISGCSGSILVNDWSTCNVLAHYDVYNTAPPPPPVPEPATWALMGAGFAGLALAGRRRTRRPAVVA